jgi:hypothetical protein
MTNGSGVTVTESWGRCQFWTDQAIWLNLDFLKEISTKSEYKDPREFYILSNDG